MEPSLIFIFFGEHLLMRVSCENILFLSLFKYQNQRYQKFTYHHQIINMSFFIAISICFALPNSHSLMIKCPDMHRAYGAHGLRHRIFLGIKIPRYTMGHS
jgi:hypothetical protein